MSYVSKSSNPSHQAVIDKALENNFGEKDPYSYSQGLHEYAEEFSRTNLPFGFYVIKGIPTVYINDSLLDLQNQNLIKNVKTSRTPMSGIYMLIETPKNLLSRTDLLEEVEKVGYDN